MATSDRPGVSLSDLLGSVVTSGDDQPLGRVKDLVGVLADAGYPRVTGLVLEVSGRDLFVHLDQVPQFGDQGLRLASTRLDVRPFERREREVLLRQDILGHRLVDLTNARLVRAHDVRLSNAGGDWLVTGVQLRAKRWWRTGPETSTFHDWQSFEALIGHAWTQPVRTHRGRLRALRAADLADLIEDASDGEQVDILTHVHADPDLEADVFEELDDVRPHLLASRSDDDVAQLLTRMDADDAVDVIAELPQERRLAVLALMPADAQDAVRRLLTYNPSTAGGLMGVEFLALPTTATVRDALDLLRDNRQHLTPTTAATIHLTGHDGVLHGTVPTIEMLRHDPHIALTQLADPSPLHADPQDDLANIAVTMADHNLATLPVTDHGRLIGILTVDDILDATIPPQWRNLDE